MISKWLGGVLVLSASAMLAAQSPSPYNGAAEKVVSGTIKTAVALPAADGSVGVHLDLRTAEGMVDVHVAPAMFIGQENFWFFADEAVVVTGFTLAGRRRGADLGEGRQEGLHGSRAPARGRYAEMGGGERRRRRLRRQSSADSAHHIAVSERKEVHNG